MSFSGLMNEVCDVQRATVGAYSGPEPVKAYATLYEDVACCRQVVGNREVTGPVFGQVLTHKVFFAGGADVARHDRLVFVDATFEVQTVSEPRKHHVEALCTEVGR